MKISRTLALLAICFSNTTLAQDQAEDFDYVTSYIENNCDYNKAIEKGITFNQWFSDYDQFVTKTALIACRAIFDDKGNQPDISEYWSDDMQDDILRNNLSTIESAFSLDENTKFSTLKDQLRRWKMEPNLPINDGVPQPAQFVGIQNPTTFIWKYFLTTPSGLTQEDNDDFELENKHTDYCTRNFEGAKDCKQVFVAFNKITDKLSAFQSLDKIQKHNAYVAVQKGNWERYSDNSRFQTFIDVAFTSWVYRDHFSRADDIIAPPPLQLFALRPSLVYEHLNDAPKGERDEPALAIEWLGFNAWDMKIPLGVSLTSVYADREVGKSIGHGLTFHINNSFSFGFASRGNGDNSVYINIELMDWFAENQNLVNAYRKLN